MRPLRYSINVTLDGCCDHREGIADEDVHRHAVENLESNPIAGSCLANTGCTTGASNAC